MSRPEKEIEQTYKLICEQSKRLDLKEIQGGLEQCLEGDLFQEDH